MFKEMGKLGKNFTKAADQFAYMEEYLKDLIAQWEETIEILVMSFCEDNEHNNGCIEGYRECIDELKQIMDGDLTPLEKWRTDAQ